MGYGGGSIRKIDDDKLQLQKELGYYEWVVRMLDDPLTKPVIKGMSREEAMKKIEKIKEKLNDYTGTD